ncbi:PorV/PorQ family protein [bacterium]|nr:PorV/PorQ family protein [bacterium]
MTRQSSIHRKQRLPVRRLIAAALGLIVIAGSSYGPCISQVYAAGQAAAYLREGIGARAMGMGNAGTALADDATVAYWNPAALPFLEAISIASQTGILEWDRSWNFLNFIYPGIRQDGGRYAFGASWVSFSAGDDIEARTFNRPEADYTFKDMQDTYLFSAAAKTPAGLSLGANIKIITHSLDEVSGNGLGMDLAIFQKVTPHWQWGLMMQDVYSTIQWPGDYLDRLPMLLRAGVLHRMLENKLLVAVDLGGEFFHAAGAFREFHYQLGVEYQFIPRLAVRAGLDSGQWTLGAGYGFLLKDLAIVQLDYALAGEASAGMGLTHLLSLVINLLPG